MSTEEAKYDDLEIRELTELEDKLIREYLEKNEVTRCPDDGHLPPDSSGQKMFIPTES